MAIGRVLIALVGIVDALAGAALILVPEWFYQNVGTFPPFNRHYAGDAGSFLAPVGVALLFAARDPRRYMPILLTGLAISWLHALNHAYDAVVHPGAGQAGLVDTANVTAIAVALTAGVLLVRRADERPREAEAG